MTLSRRALVMAAAAAVALVGAACSSGSSPDGGSLDDVDPAVRALIESVQGGDAADLSSRAVTLQQGCTRADGAGGPPKCDVDDAEGTSYEVFPHLGCEGGWVRVDELPQAIAGLVAASGELAAVARWPAGAGAGPFAAGDTLVVFRPAAGQPAIAAVGFVLEMGRVIRTRSGCATAEQLLRNGEGDPLPLVYRPAAGGES